MNWLDEDDCNFYPDPSKQSPIEFIVGLKWRDCGEFNSFFFINPEDVPDNWVKKEHLPTLISLLDNEEIAFPIVSSYTSTTYRFHGYTTIGRHAYHLIRSYQGAIFPYDTFPNNSNDTLKLTPIQKKTMLDWWGEQD